MKISRNPYTQRGTLQDPDDFFGRTRQLHDIYTRILGGQSISLVGERRIGKSSLLNAIRFEREEYGLPTEFKLVSLDLQSIAGCTEEFFLEFLTTIVAVETNLKVTEPGRLGLTNVALDLLKQGKRLVVLLDEFSLLAHNEEISPQLYAFLRAWSVQCRVSLVVAFREGTVEGMVERDRTGSPFLNLFGVIYVGPFERDEAEELITIPAENHGIKFEQEEIDAVIDIAGYFPLFISITCYHLFELRHSPHLQSNWRNELESRCIDELLPHFQYIWDVASAPERAAVRQLAKSLGTPGIPKDVLRGLLRKGIAVSSAGPRLFSPLFADFVRLRCETDEPQSGRALMA